MGVGQVGDGKGFSAHSTDLVNLLTLYREGGIPTVTVAAKSVVVTVGRW